MAYNYGMQPFNIETIDPAELAPIPEVPETFGPRNEEDVRVLDLVLTSLSSGAALPLDATFFAELDAIISQH